MSDLPIEVAFALAGKQSLLRVTVPAGSSVASVIDASGIESLYPDEGLGELAVGIWGRVVDREQTVRPGDRVEIYRPLELDPREARRRLALAGRTMGNVEKD